jgi:hypothetical protein
MSSPPTTNLSLADEIEAIGAIFEADTIEVVSSDSSSTIVHLKPPSQPFTFRLSFCTEYPDLPPIIDGTASTGDTEKGAGDAAVNILAEVLGNVYSPGQVCLFELISDVGPLLEERYGAHPEAPSAKREESRSEQPTGEYREPALITGQDTPFPAPKWIASESLGVMKSTFIAHAAPCSSKDEALSHISHLISSSKKIASATHNITAYRIRQPDTTSYIQDCDDDGESAAGGRLLHLLQLMDCENVVVVVTRWFGGVKLGGERFRCIGNVAREVLVKGGWGKDAKDKGGKKH